MIPTRKKKKEILSAFRVDVCNCARCGENHQHQIFLPFTRPPRHWTHYAECPKVHEPILMRVSQDEQKKDTKSAFNSGDLICAMCGGNRIPQRGKL